MDGLARTSDESAAILAFLGAWGCNEMLARLPFDEPNGCPSDFWYTSCPAFSWSALLGWPALLGAAADAGFFDGLLAMAFTLNRSIGVCCGLSSTRGADSSSCGRTAGCQLSARSQRAHIPGMWHVA